MADALLCGTERGDRSKICGYIILFSIGGVTRSLFAGQALYTDLQVGDHGTLSYRDGRVVGFTRAA